MFFTTRADTLFGATYCVFSSRTSFIKKKLSRQNITQKVLSYQQNTANKSERVRLTEQKEKTGIFIGRYAINPINNQAIPIWISDYVLMSYGTGAIMAVPAHDERDYEFAKKFNLPIQEVITGGDIEKEAYTQKGKIINSDFLNGLDSKLATQKVISYLKEKKLGEKKINYKLRDWLFSRQRYWGEPIPVLLDADYNSYPVNEENLPVKLPHTDSFLPLDNGESSLAKLESWVEVWVEGKKYCRETNTMPQWAGSCWYYLRFLDPQNKDEIFSKEAENYWIAC